MELSRPGILISLCHISLIIIRNRAKSTDV